MRKGLMIGADEGPYNTIDKLIQFAIKAEQTGFDNLWMANIFGHDAISAMTLAGRETHKIGLGTAVTPSFPRHPTALAQQAMTAASACKGRFTLGVGLSHKMVIEDMMGLSYDKPAAHMREYLEVLLPLLRGEQTAHNGTQYNVNLQLSVEDAQPVSVVVAALGPAMLRVAGSLADGTSTWMTGPNTLESHIIPSIHQAAEEAGRQAPRVVAGLPIALTNNVDQAKQAIDKGMEMYGYLPSYRAMLDREGVAGPGDVALLGDETALLEQLRHLKNIGVTDFNAFIFPVDPECFERTLNWLAETDLNS